MGHTVSVSLTLLCILLIASACFATLGGHESAPSIGIFEGNHDIGVILHSGAVAYDSNKKTYTVSGSGENMWFAKDAFHFVWKKVSGDLSFTADIDFVGTGKEPHRKACLMVRQSLDTDSAYSDAALHGDGLTSLQFRETQGATTHEVQANAVAPKCLRLEKRGEWVRMYLADEKGEFHFCGSATRLALKGDYYIGLGVCSHNKDNVEQAVFSKVDLNTDLPAPSHEPTLYSTLETQAIASTDRHVAYVTTKHIEAPNWLPNGETLLFNGGGRIYQIPSKGGEPKEIPTGFAIRCNNDHGVTPDGKTLIISDQSQGDHQSRIYTLPITGGEPKLVTPLSPSYWHGVSPDGKTLAYCAQRNGQFDIYSIPIEGGEERRLTDVKGLDDGPEYSSDGRYLYFNSERTGRMQVWRMKSDGSEQEQVTTDEYNNWFPHLSPDGKNMVFLSYEKGVTGHPPNKDVQLRIMNLETKQIKLLAKVFGGQGTINVPSWSPDSKKIAFVTYQLIP